MQNFKSGIIAAASIALSSKLINQREKHLQAKSIGKLFQTKHTVFYLLAVSTTLYLAWPSCKGFKQDEGFSGKTTFDYSSWSDFITYRIGRTSQGHVSIYSLAKNYLGK